MDLHVSLEFLGDPPPLKKGEERNGGGGGRSVTPYLPDARCTCLNIMHVNIINY